MQYTKDSFYIALRDRLAALDPARTVFLDGADRPAVIVAENEPVTATTPLENAFYLNWEAVALVGPGGARRPVMRLEAVIRYRTSGAAEQIGVDRGRALARLDLELAQILSPRFTAKKDYTQSPEVDLESTVLWTAPEFTSVEVRDRELLRTVRLAVFFRPEVDLP
ncbi:MAG: hypothetical protein M3P27_09710 [Acidobacteriota bacterium]|nr:hypothetical protein [Acidobacteriota bacterium]